MLGMKVLPSTATLHVVDDMAANFQVACNFNGRSSVVKQIECSTRLRLRNLSVVVSLPVRCAIPSLSIGDVLVVCADVKMSQIYTRWVITAM